MNKNKHLLVYFIILCLHHSLGWCRSSSSSIESRLDNLENKLENNLSLELVSKVDELQREIQELRGMLEEKHHATKIAKINNPDQIAYESAHKLVEEKKFQEAILAFKDFLINHSDSSHVPNANYWLGELYLTEHNFELAANYFLEVANKHQEHMKAPDALLKLGLLELERENWQGAKDYFNQIKTNYAHSSRVHMADAKLQSIERDGH